MEQWKAVVGYEGWYEVSSLGQVRRIRGGRGTVRVGHIIKQLLSTSGRRQVTLSRFGKQKTLPVHVMVAYAFIGPRPDGKEINHIDYDCRNNKVENLEYVTKIENTRHAYTHGKGLTAPRGSRNANSRLTEGDVVAIRASRVTRDKIAAMYNVSPVTIKFIRNRRHWKHVA